MQRHVLQGFTPTMVLKFPDVSTFHHLVSVRLKCQQKNYRKDQLLVTDSHGNHLGLKI